MVSFHAASMKQ